MTHALALWLAGQAASPAGEVDRLSGSLERGGLYTIIAVLLLVGAGVIPYLYLSKEKQQAAYTAKLLTIVEEQSKVSAKQAVLTERVEALLVRVVDRLGRSKE